MSFKKKVCLSVCLTFFDSADARDLGLMTLFIFSQMKSHKILKTKFISVSSFSGKIRSMSIYKREGVNEWTDLWQVPLHPRQVRQPLPVHSEDELPCYRVETRITTF